MSNGTLYTTEIEHDGGVAGIEVTVNHDGTETATIRFGSSFTLRLDEVNMFELAYILADGAGELRTRREGRASREENQNVC